MKWATRKPDFQVGDEVYVIDAIIGTSRVLKTTIRKIPINIGYEQELYWEGWYDLATMTFPGDHIPPTCFL